MAEPLKNQFLQRPFLERLSALIQAQHPEWDEEGFWKTLYDENWDGLELKGRMKHASLVLGQCLPNDYSAAINILCEVAPEFSGFDGLLFSEYVLHHGLQHPELSLDALELFTQSGSAEFAIRPFILHHEELTMAKMLNWSTHENVHVRRLASEGCRPRLPWAPALPKYKTDPSPIIPILENLKDDPEIYVRKSVANNLNDLSKDHPDTVLDMLSVWKENADPTRNWIIKQALRGLIKAGHPKALRIIGFKKEPVEIKDFNCPDEVVFGNALNFGFTLVNPGKSTAKYPIDYVIYHQKANGSLSPKVFKIGSFDLGSKQEKSWVRKHSFVPITTRKYHGGLHKIAIQVNGDQIAERPFKLIMN